MSLSKTVSSKVVESYEVTKKPDVVHAKSIALCHGCFDILHHGHLLHLRKAKAMANILVVSVTSDEFVNKGPGRPVFPLQQRMEMLAALEVVDYVVPSRGPSSAQVIRDIQPTFYVKGADYRDKPDPTRKIDTERAMVEQYGGKLVFTDEPTASSTALVTRVLDPLFGKIGKATVHLIGESIRDVYHKVRLEGTTKKHGTPVHRIVETREDNGGVLATLGHVSPFVRCTYLTSQPEADMVVKTRYLEAETGTRLFRTSFIPETIWLNGCPRSSFYLVDRPDVIIVNDFGHGLITDSVIQFLRDMGSRGVFIAINCQLNTSSKANFITKFDSLLPNFVCLNLEEASAALRAIEINPEGLSHREVAQQLARAYPRATVVVTNKDKEAVATKTGLIDQVSKPAHKIDPVEITGAGDAFFALSALAAWAGGSLETILTVGHAAGAAKCMIPGNSRSITRADLEKFL